MADEAANSDIEVEPRRAEYRGHISKGWVDSYHTFSFDTYQNREFENFAILHRLSEDRAKSAPLECEKSNYHAEYDMICYMISGTLIHKDALGHYQELKRGHVQMLSAGSGISHSEFNRSPSEEIAHYISIWLKPNIPTFKQKYQVQQFTESDKQDKLCCILKAGSVVEGSTSSLSFEKIEQSEAQLARDLANNCNLHPSEILSSTESSIHSCILTPGKSLSYQFGAGTSSYGEKRYIYIFIPSMHAEVPHLQHIRYTDSNRSRSCLKVNGNTILNEGDGAFIKNAYSAPSSQGAKMSNNIETDEGGSDEEDDMGEGSSGGDSSLILESIGSEPVELLIVDCERSRHDHHHHHHSKALR